MKGLVLDTSALYYGKDFPQGYELVITPGVARELDKEGMAERLELLLATRIRISSPTRKSLDSVRRAAEQTGDSRRLSPTDTEVLALALELGYQLVTDDYSIQNTAAVLGVSCRGIEQEGITKVLKWKARCIGCGRTYDPDVEVCSVCGSPTRTSSRRGGRRS